MDPYVGEIRLFAGNYEPQGWLFCDGQQLPIVQYQVLFAVIGFAFGGDGHSRFALPDLRGRLPIHQGIGVGLSYRKFGLTGGTVQETLTEKETPNHHHAAGCMVASSANEAIGSVWAVARDPVFNQPVNIYSDHADLVMNPNILTPVGGGQPHNNLQPYIALNYIIATDGIYPDKP